MPAALFDPSPDNISPGHSRNFGLSPPLKRQLFSRVPGEKSVEFFEKPPDEEIWRGGGKQFRGGIKFSREFLKPTCTEVGIGVVKRDETESSISRVDRLFLEQREPEKPWPTSFRDSVGNSRPPDE